jgi:hypothetical protein
MTAKEPDAHGQLWNIDPAHRPPQTVLDDMPTTTEQKVVPDEAVRQGA